VQSATAGRRPPAAALFCKLLRMAIFVPCPRWRRSAPAHGRCGDGSSRARPQELRSGPPGGPYPLDRRDIRITEIPRRRSRSSPRRSLQGHAQGARARDVEIDAKAMPWLAQGHRRRRARRGLTRISTRVSEGTNVTVNAKPAVVAPGVGDDSAGSRPAELLRAMDAAGSGQERHLLVVTSARRPRRPARDEAAFHKGKYRDSDQIFLLARRVRHDPHRQLRVGSKRYRVTFSGPAATATSLRPRQSDGAMSQAVVELTRSRRRRGRRHLLRERSRRRTS